MQVKLVVSGNNVRVLQNVEHTTEHHANQIEHRLTVSMIQSIQVAVHADVRRRPLLEGIPVIHVFHPTQEMRELFGETNSHEGVQYPKFDSDSAQYHKCVGMSYL